MGLLIGRKKPDKPIGKVLVEQMKLDFKERWILQRISPICENCNKNRYYDIYKEYKYKVYFNLISCGVVYKIRCPECGETIELEYEEFSTIRPFMSINERLEKGKITESEHRILNDRIRSKAKKRIMRKHH